MRTVLDRIATDFRISTARLGYPVVLGAVLGRLLRLIGVKQHYGIVLFADAVNTSAIHNPRSYATRFLSPSELRRIAEQQPGMFTPESASRAIARGDRCYGVFDNGQLISSAWYSSRPTKGEHGFEVYFSAEFFYGYRAHTVRERRGEHLYALGILRGTQDGAVEGRKGTVAYVDAANLPMLMTSTRLGSRIFGVVWSFRLGPIAWSLRSPGCRRFGFGFRRLARGDSFSGNKQPRLL